MSESKPTTTSTASLLIKIRDHDEQDAWREFVERYGRRIYGFFKQRDLASEDAEELTQDVFVRIRKSIRTFDPRKGSSQGWVLQIARHIWIDLLRARRHKPKFRPLESVTPDDFASEFRKEDFDRITALALQNTRQALANGKSQHPDRDWNIFQRDWRDHAARKQIAEETQMTEAAVGMVILRVLNIFQAEVIKLMGDMP